MEKIITGRCASKGKVRGSVKFMGKNNLAISDVENSILVVEYLMPTMLYMISYIKGVIAETGAVTSHPAIICREFKVPFIVDIDCPIKLFKEGSLIELNATEGLIRIVK